MLVMTAEYGVWKSVKMTGIWASSKSVAYSGGSSWKYSSKTMRAAA